MEPENEARRTRAMRELLAALALAASAAPGFVPLELPNGERAFDPLTLLVWLALCAPTVGCACVAWRVRGWPYAAAIWGVWASLLSVLAGVSERLIPTPLWAAATLGGLLASGLALGHCFPRPRATAAGLACATVCAVWLPSAPAALDGSWPVALAEPLFACSPATLVAECAGVDWMRVQSVYAGVGTDRFTRSAWPGELAGPASLLLGCACWGLAAWIAKRRTKPSS